MNESKITFKQYCTHLKRNVVMEKIIYDDGRRKIICVERNCDSKDDNCKNKIRKK